MFGFFLYRCFDARAGFCQIGQLFDTHSAQQHDITNQSKANDVNQCAPEIGEMGLDNGKDRQVGRAVGADIEHVKIGNAVLVGNLVGDHSDHQRNGEYGQCLQNGFVLQLYIAAVQQICAEEDHRTVAHHSLNIDADGTDKHIRRIEHHTNACKHGKGG